MKKQQKSRNEQPNRAWVEVDYGAIENNARVLKGLLAGEAAMMAVVKSNAYGHGMVESARAALRGGAAWLGVDEMTEALALRAKGIRAPILVLGYTLPVLYKAAAEKKISLTISSLESLQNLAKARLSRKLRIHIKFDTGLYRQGISETHVQQVIRLISAKDFPAVIEGAYTHFAVMEDPMRQEYSKMQARAFKGIVAKLQAKGFTPITHASASSGILFSKDFHFDMSRAGIVLYGLWPSPEIKKWADGGERVNIVPALSWKTIVSEVKLANKGSKVGYDLTYELARPSRIAIIPVGYWPLS
ncbi:alanine racemase, partial [Candidatus Parcubacteria bacterium]|nr:alanine racemase [Candidatus Parcubacteria bacterium]